jgi:hypothetical protein
MSKKTNYRKKRALVRLTVMQMPPESTERQVSVRYMQNFSDMDIRVDLRITKKSLLDSRKKIRALLLAAFGEEIEITLK